MESRREFVKRAKQRIAKRSTNFEKPFGTAEAPTYDGTTIVALNVYIERIERVGDFNVGDVAIHGNQIRKTPIYKHLMKAIETTATINDQGQLLLDSPLAPTQSRRVRVIVLIPEEDEIDPDDTPTEVILEGIRQGWHEAMTGQTYPIAQLWDGIDAD